MTWNSVSNDQIKIAQQVVLWIKTAREAGYGGSDWLPTYSDIIKSALFERIRNGKDPLPYPPPRAMSCPWYAVVEDIGPHYVGNDHTLGPVFYKNTFDKLPLNEMVIGDTVTIFQSDWLVEHKNKTNFIVSDAGHSIKTPYRFYLWYDPNWVLPNLNSSDPEVIKRYTGGWFLRNIDFGEIE